MTVSAPLKTLATTAPGTAQRAVALFVCIGFAATTVALTPVASRAVPAMPGFIATYQTALIVTYAVTTYLFATQYRRTRSVPLLVLTAGGLFTTLVVLIQLLTFPAIFAPGPLLGVGPDSTTWLWTFWHAGPVVFALAYALLENDRRPRLVAPQHVARWGGVAALGTIAAVGIITVIVTRYVHILPKCVEGDDYRLLTTSGVGPLIIASTAAALAALVWRTRLRSVLQLWLAVSLFLLVLDNWITLAGAARGTIGWMAGRLEALIAGMVLLGVYLREIEFLYARAEHIADERGRERAALQLARDNLSLALESAGMGDWHLDLASGAVRRTPRHDQIFGYDGLQPHWSQATLVDHVLPQDRPDVEAAFDRAMTEGLLDVACRIRRAGDGRERWIAIRGKAYYGDSGQPVAMAGVVLDTTEQRHVEERLAQAQKMEAIGQITGGVAHDFNNLLTVIVGNLDMIARRPEDTGRVSRLASSGLIAAKRGAEVTEKLLAFSRRQIVRPETVNPNRLLHEFKPLLARAVGETIKIEYDLDVALHPVRLDPGQFESAILNLAVNARDAMANGGRLTVKTANAVLSEDDFEVMPELGPGEYISVFVSDTGEGMDAATMARAFEPFFTTKEIGRGTGLGLSQVYGFAKQAGGQVRLESSTAGTTVMLYLPRSVERPVSVKSGVGDLPLRGAQQGEVVLVVEDEPSVLEMAVESLEELGYETVTATEAHAALERLRGRERIDIVFSDVVMPGGMNGVQLAVEAQRVRPGVRVLLASGYVGAALGAADLPDDLPFIAKPYAREDLAKKLSVVLGRS